MPELTVSELLQSVEQVEQAVVNLGLLAANIKTFLSNFAQSPAPEQAPAAPQPVEEAPPTEAPAPLEVVPEEAPALPVDQPAPDNHQ